MVSKSKNKKSDFRTCDFIVETDKKVEIWNDGDVLRSPKQNKMDTVVRRRSKTSDRILLDQENMKFKYPTCSGITTRRSRVRKFGTEITNEKNTDELYHKKKHEPNAGRTKSELENSVHTNLNKLMTSTPMTLRKRVSGSFRSDITTCPDLPNLSELVSPLGQRSVEMAQAEHSTKSQVTKDAAPRFTDSDSEQIKGKMSRHSTKRARTEPSAATTSMAHLESNIQKEAQSSPQTETSYQCSHFDENAEEYKLFEDDWSEKLDSGTVADASPKQRKKVIKRNADKSTAESDRSDSIDCLPTKNICGKSKQKAKTTSKKPAIVKDAKDEEAKRELMKIKEMEDILNNYSLIVE